MEYGSNGWSVFLVPARISSDLAGIRYTAADEEEKGRFLLLFHTSTLYWMACGTSHQITLASINMTAKSSHAQHICRRVIFFSFWKNLEEVLFITTGDLFYFKSWMGENEGIGEGGDHWRKRDQPLAKEIFFSPVNWCQDNIVPGDHFPFLICVVCIRL